MVFQLVNKRWAKKSEKNLRMICMPSYAFNRKTLFAELQRMQIFTSYLHFEKLYLWLDGSDGISHWDRVRTTLLEKADVQFKLGILCDGQMESIFNTFMVLSL